LMDILGTAIGTGISGAIVAASLRSNGEAGPGLAAAFAVAIVVGFGGLGLTGRLRRARPRGLTADPGSTPADASAPPAPG